MKKVNLGNGYHCYKEKDGTFSIVYEDFLVETDLPNVKACREWVKENS